MSFLIRNALLITANARDDIYQGDLRIEGNRIEEIGKVSGSADRALDATGLWVFPGFVQTHVHLCQTLFRGLADDLELLDWLQRRIWPLEAAHDEKSLYWSARLGIAELLKGGTTTVLSMETVRHTEEVFRAVEEAGIRAAAGKCIMDMGDAPAPLQEEGARAIEESLLLMKYWDGKSDGRIRYAFAPRFALSCSREVMEEVGRTAKASRTLIHTHSSENRKEVELVRQQTGYANVEYFHNMGLTTPNLFLAHCIWLNDREISILKETATRVTHCPGSNLKLASGIADITRYIKEGLKLSLGADGAACNNNLDMFQEMRLAALLQKTLHGPTALSAREVFRLATIEGARALHSENEIGSLEKGKRADLVVFDPRSASVWPHHDVYATLVYAGRPQNVKAVFVDGVLLVSDGKLAKHDEREILCKSAEALKQLLPRAEKWGFR
ncbi:MAG TPA: 5'-deoxyadenosine deaminase [Acidobacteriota bacterium]|jgi:cytosine/adenosine deaminase-related metal-dependent hydrolase|nr:5'-deoxyadenosine deaminase [Acidobacteriota bacterium]